MADLLYLDTSAFLRRVLGADGADHVDIVTTACLDQGGSVVASRLLWLESHRVAVREAQAGNDIADVVHANLATVSQLPLNEDVWSRAFGIDTHIKTLDSLHLATCAAVGADLLSFDDRMNEVAVRLGIRLSAAP